jgi:hypothetical protein
MMHLVPSFREWHNSCRSLSNRVLIYRCSSIVGRPRHQGVMVGMGQKDSYVGYYLTPFLSLSHSKALPI